MKNPENGMLLTIDWMRQQSCRMNTMCRSSGFVIEEGARLSSLATVIEYPLVLHENPNTRFLALVSNIVELNAAYIDL